MNTRKTSTATQTVTFHEPDTFAETDELLRRALDGDRGALDAAVRELRPQLLAEASQHLGDDLESEAEDVVQDLFLAIVEGHIRAPRRRGGEHEHLLRLLRVLAHRRRARGPTLPGDLE